MCYYLLNLILELYIYIKLFILSYYKRDNFEINKIFLIGKKKKYKIRDLIKNWNIIKALSEEIKYIDIEYYFNNKIYKTCVKYPNEISYPIDMKTKIPFYKQVSEIITKNEKLNDIIIQYIQPNRDINILNITMEDICKINNIEYNDNFIISNNSFKEKELSIYDVISL